MTEPKSECCGADVKLFPYPKGVKKELAIPWENSEWRCSKCHKPCKVKSKEGGEE